MFGPERFLDYEVVKLFSIFFAVTKFFFGAPLKVPPLYPNLPDVGQTSARHWAHQLEPTLPNPTVIAMANICNVGRIQAGIQGLAKSCILM